MTAVYQLVWKHGLTAGDEGSHERSLAAQKGKCLWFIGESRNYVRRRRSSGQIAHRRRSGPVTGPPVAVSGLKAVQVFCL